MSEAAFVVQMGFVVAVTVWNVFQLLFVCEQVGCQSRVDGVAYSGSMRVVLRFN
jgi:hypothetical protein